MVDLSVTQMAVRVEAGLMVGKRPVKITRTKAGGVYVIFNVISGRAYVGSSYRIWGRWCSHIHDLRRGKHHSRSLQRSWEKHGSAAFSWEILERIDDQSILFAREQHWIDSIGAFHDIAGFNVHPNAGGARGHRLSVEIREKLSKIQKGKKKPPRTEAWKKAQSLARLGKKRSAASCAKQSATMTGKKLPPFSAAHRAAISAARKRLFRINSRIPGQGSLFDS